MIEKRLPYLLAIATFGALFWEAFGQPILARSDEDMKTIMSPLSDGFDYPVGYPNAFGYYKSRGFSPWHHMGEDWNVLGGGNKDLGKPVHSIANGVVVYSKDYRSNWGNVIIVRHPYRHSNGQIYYVDSLYGHLDRRDSQLYDIVRRGQIIGTIGTNHGMYTAHLHFEIRKNISVGLIHSKYAKDYSNYYSPTKFIDLHRDLRKEYREFRVPVDSFHKSYRNQLVGSSLAAIPTLPGESTEPPPMKLDPEIRMLLAENDLLQTNTQSEVDARMEEFKEERNKIRDFWDKHGPDIK